MGVDGGGFILSGGGWQWAYFGCWWKVVGLLWVVVDVVEFILSGSGQWWIYLGGAKINRQTRNIAFLLQISESSQGFYHQENESNSKSWKNILVTIIS